jgi:hypothetical protein
MSSGSSGSTRRRGRKETNSNKRENNTHWSRNEGSSACWVLAESSEYLLNETALTPRLLTPSREQRPASWSSLVTGAGLSELKQPRMLEGGQPLSFFSRKESAPATPAVVG